MSTFAPFPIDAELTAITIAYRNRRLIADEVLPRVPVNTQSFKYTKFDLTEGFTVPETLVGRTSQPNRVEFTGKEVTDSTEDNALDAPVPQADIENAKNKPNFNPLGRAVEQTTNLIALGREVRTSKLIFNRNSYDTKNRTVLTGTDQWSHPDADPAAQITDALDSVIMRPNLGILGRRVATLLCRHPAIVKAYNGTLGDKGMVPLQFLADLLEMEKILIGEAFVNAAQRGKNPDIIRTWGNHAAFIYRDTLADTAGGTTFGFTAEWGNRISGSEFDGKIGMRGGQMVRVGESLKELVAAKDLGYFFENAVTG